jgi:hypothetical protein
MPNHLRGELRKITRNFDTPIYGFYFSLEMGVLILLKN